MSSTLVRRSLELVDSDITNKAGKRKGKSKQRKSETSLRTANKSTKKPQKKGHRQKNTHLNSLSKNEERKSCTEAHMTVDELRMRLRVHEDQTEGNVCFLQRLAGNKIDEDMAKKIFARAVKAPKDQQKIEHEPESTVFTEEDFEKFEKEYFAC